MENIIITGSTGFVGRNLVPLLIDSGYNVLELTRDIIKSQKLYGNKTSKFKLGATQISMRSKIRRFDPHICIHLASYITPNDSFDESKKLIDSNISLLISILDGLKESNLKYFINTGTFAEYSKDKNKLSPAYLYAATKTASRPFIEYYSNLLKFKYCTVIPYTIYGGVDSQKKIIDLIFDSIGSEIPLKLSPGNQILDFIHIDDVIGYYLYLIKNKSQISNKSVFHLGTGKGHSLRQLALIIEELTASKTNISWGAKEYRENDIMYAVSTSTFSDQFNPIKLRDGIGLFKNIKLNRK